MRDLSTEVTPDAEVAPVEKSSPEGLHVIRHSAAHITAQAVQRAFPGTQLGIGPAIENGFYYDFKVVEPFTPEDLAKIEREIKIGSSASASRSAAGPRGRRGGVRVQLRGEPFKMELA